MKKKNANKHVPFQKKYFEGLIIVNVVIFSLIASSMFWLLLGIISRGFNDDGGTWAGLIFVVIFSFLKIPLSLVALINIPSIFVYKKFHPRTKWGKLLIPLLYSILMLALTFFFLDILLLFNNGKD